MTTTIQSDNCTGPSWQEQISQEFSTKNRILKDAFTPTAQMDYIYRVWGSSEKNDMVILLQRYKQLDDGTLKGSYFQIIIDEIFDLLLFRDDLYSYYTDFRNGKVGIKTVKRVRALCIDLDHMSPKDLKKLVSKKLTKMKHPPSYIVNSGNGVHLIYLFNEPIDVSSGGRIFGMKNLLIKLTEQFRPTKDYDYKLDGQSANLIQPYRVPGALTKNGNISSVYKSGPECKLDILEKWLGCEVFSNNGNFYDNYKRPKLEYLPNGKKNFYTYCLEKIRTPDKIERYLAMFGVAIIAWKCRIPKEKVLQDLRNLLDYYNSHASGNPGGWMSKNEIDKAMGGYHNKFVKVTSDQLSEYLGIKFKKAKRNGLSQEEHLKKIHAEKKNLKRSQVFEFMKVNPGATQKKIAAELGMSTTTVRKYYQECYKAINE